MFKRCLLSLLLAGVFVAVPAFSQDNSSAPPAQAQGEGMGHGMRHMDPEHRTEMLAKHLKLNSDQQAKVLEIMKSQQSQMESLRSDTSTSQDDRRAKMMEIHKASNDQIRALLDSNQQKKFDEMQSHQWQGHHPDGQAPPDSNEQK